MKDIDKTKEQLINELVEMRHRIAELKADRKRTEEVLRQSEEELRKMLESVTDGIFVIDLNGIITEANEKAVEMHGFGSKDKLLGKSALRLVVPRDYKRIATNMRKALKQGAIRGIEYTLLKEDGSEFPGELSTSVLKDASGNPVGHITVARDITERKQADKELRESERRFRDIAENASEWIWETNADGKYTYVSPVVEKILGYKPGELLDKHFYDLFHPDDLEEAKKSAFKIFAKKQPFHEFVNRNIHKNGEIVWLSTSGVPMLDEEGNLLGYRGADIDITERKQAEEALWESNKLKQLLMESFPNKIFFKDTSSVYTFCNSYYASDLGISPEEIRGKTDYDFYPRDLADKYRADDQRIIASGQFEQIEEPYKIDGEERTVLTVKTPVRDADGNVIGILGIFTDITERKLAEEKARELEVLKEVDRMRSGLLANVSHELRTPLASIKGFASTLLQPDVEWSEEEQREFLQAINQESDRLTRIINDLLDMSRIDAGALKFLEMGNYQISEILDSINGRLAGLTEHYQLQVIVPESPLWVFADEMRIGQVLANLVDNATKFSKNGSLITIEAVLSDDQVIISVTDKGEGIPSKLLDRVFDRFYQAESIVTGRKSGTGLGLSICRGIIEAHGGKIWVESQEGKGSKFSFSLPVSKKEGEVAQGSSH